MKIDKSISEFHSSIDPEAKKRGWQRLFLWFGPAYLVSVGYMDPGNWATDIAGGAQFEYKLLWVLLMSNLMALFLQSLSARLGIVRGLDLAQANRISFPRRMNYILYGLAELAIIATDLAEVLGVAIGLNMLFGLPLIWGVLITLLDTILILYLQKLGMRKLEAFIIALILIIGICFFLELFWAKPSFSAIASGLKPAIPNAAALYITIGIIGATVMPHNLYLHSALVQSRKTVRKPQAIRRALRFNLLDSAIALNLAFLVNAAILILAGAVFFNTEYMHIAELADAQRLLAPLLGTRWASILFAIALIAAGQSSTLTGTLAGQIVMEGYLQLRISPIARRLLSRGLAIIPAVIALLLFGDRSLNGLLILSQVVLSLQLSFAIIPLLQFVSDGKTMGEFTLHAFWKVIGWIIIAVIAGLNLKLVVDSLMQYFIQTDSIGLKGLFIALGLGFVGLMLAVTFWPLLNIKKAMGARKLVHPKPLDLNLRVSTNRLQKIALALDFSHHDEKVIQTALRFSEADTTFVLIHVTESAAAVYSSSRPDDLEFREDEVYLQRYKARIEALGMGVKTRLGYGNRCDFIKQTAMLENCDLLVVGSHGHRGWRDYLFGETVNRLRHITPIPILIAK